MKCGDLLKKTNELKDKIIKTIIDFCEDVWVWISLDTVSKAFINFELGKRVKENADLLIENTTEKLANAPLLITADEYSCYEKPIAETFESPFVQIVKTREKGKVVDISCNLFQGTLKSAVEAITSSKSSNTFNTAFIERFNSTIRHFNSRLRRKAYTFSKEIEKLELSLSLFQGYYNISRPHMGIKNKTPAMMCGKTNHCWSIRELMSHRF
jgi:IS1 family transposase